jgi:hypothetical protein
MGQRLRQQLGLPEAVADALLQLVKRVLHQKKSAVTSKRQSDVPLNLMSRYTGPAMCTCLS